MKFRGFMGGRLNSSSHDSVSAVDKLISQLRESAMQSDNNNRRARRSRQGFINTGVFVGRNAGGGVVANTIHHSGCDTCSARLSDAAMGDIRAALAKLGPHAEITYCALLGVESLDQIRVSETRQAALAVTAAEMALRSRQGPRSA